jgi:hypothetical protein
MLTVSVCLVLSAQGYTGVHGQSSIQGTEDADVLGKERLNISFLGHMSAVSVLPYVGRLKTKIGRRHRNGSPVTDCHTGYETTEALR